MNAFEYKKIIPEILQKREIERKMVSLCPSLLIQKFEK